VAVVDLEQARDLSEVRSSSSRRGDLLGGRATGLEVRARVRHQRPSRARTASVIVRRPSRAEAEEDGDQHQQEIVRAR
jgi:hypothetical protein